jgi:hypothetical protein
MAVTEANSFLAASKNNQIAAAAGLGKRHRPPLPPQRNPRHNKQHPGMSEFVAKKSPRLREAECHQAVESSQ